MTFTALNLSGIAAAKRMLSWRIYEPGRCLQAVHNAFPFQRSDAPGSYTWAIHEWQKCPADRRHPGDRHPPAGAVVLFALDYRGEAVGHICLSLGDGQLVSTDQPERGRIGITTIAEIERDWDARYLGWTNRIGGHTVITEGDTDMTLTTEQSAALTSALAAARAAEAAAVAADKKLAQQGEALTSALAAARAAEAAAKAVEDRLAKVGDGMAKTVVEAIMARFRGLFSK